MERRVEGKSLEWGGWGGFRANGTRWINTKVAETTVNNILFNVFFPYLPWRHVGQWAVECQIDRCDFKRCSGAGFFALYGGTLL